MSSELTSNAMIMIQDVDDLKSDSIKAFSNAFKKSINSPDKVVEKVKASANSLASASTAYIFWTIFFVSSVILLSLSYLEIITWLTTFIIILIVGAAILLMASLLYNRVTNFISAVSEEVDDHIADYTEGIFEDVVKAFKEGIIAYGKKRSESLDQSDPFDEDILE